MQKSPFFLIWRKQELETISLIIFKHFRMVDGINNDISASCFIQWVYKPWFDEIQQFISHMMPTEQIAYCQHESEGKDGTGWYAWRFSKPPASYHQQFADGSCRRRKGGKPWWIISSNSKCQAWLVHSVASLSLPPSPNCWLLDIYVVLTAYWS